ncbi:ribonuclease H-like domain-containing protein [Tanacetum coccineum]
MITLICYPSIVQRYLPVCNGSDIKRGDASEGEGADTAYLLLYVDDIVLTASSSDLLQQIITSLHAEFSMTDLGSLNYFLGISVTRNASGMFLSQQKYATEVLDRAGMLNCKPCRTPVDTDSKLSADGAPISDSTLYRSLAGALQYLTFTRPDISYAVQQVCLFMHDPREPHLSALKRILRYVRGTLSYGLQLYSSTTSSLVAYSDADWAGCPTTRRSTSGYCVFLGNNLLSWSSKRQFTLSRSSAEAEYRGVANAVAETCWLRNLLRELHTPLATATLVYCDNVSAVYLSSNPVQHQRTKHIEIDIHFVRDLVATGAIRVLHVPSRYQYADIFTKGLPTSLFDEFRTSLSVCSSPDLDQHNNKAFVVGLAYLKRAKKADNNRSSVVGKRKRKRQRKRKRKRQRQRSK